jgi:hypothetical protein
MAGRTVMAPPAALELRVIPDQARGDVEVELGVPEIRPVVQGAAVILAGERDLRAGLVELAAGDEREGVAHPRIGDEIARAGGGFVCVRPVERRHQGLGLPEPVALGQESDARHENRCRRVRPDLRVLARLQGGDHGVRPLRPPRRDAEAGGGQRGQYRQREEQLRPHGGPAAACDRGERPGRPHTALRMAAGLGVAPDTFRAGTGRRDRSASARAARTRSTRPRPAIA